MLIPSIVEFDFLVAKLWELEVNLNMGCGLRVLHTISSLPLVERDLIISYFHSLAENLEYD